MNQEKFEKQLHTHLTPACGCTEPIAIAYASAVAAKYLKREIASIQLALSPNVIKNAMIVCLPGAEGRCGIDLAAAMGALFGDSEANLNVIAGLSKEQIDIAEQFRQHVRIVPCKTNDPLFIEAQITSTDGNKVVVTIEGGHTQITKIEENGRVIFSQQTQPKQEIGFDTSIGEIVDYIQNHFAQQDFIDEVIRINSAMMQEGLQADYGLAIGSNVCKDFRDQACKTNLLLKNINAIIESATASVDARMAGADLPVMANSGSGNQGLVATVPVIRAAELLGADAEATRKAVALSSLIAIYIKSKHSVLSAYCGAVLAGAGVAAGLTYLIGGDLCQIKNAIQSTLGNTFGILCDGAKEMCSLKVANCVFTAIYASYLSIKNCYPKRKEGVIFMEAEQTIQKIAELGRETSCCLDEALMKIMLEA